MSIDAVAISCNSMCKDKDRHIQIILGKDYGEFNKTVIISGLSSNYSIAFDYSDFEKAIKILENKEK
jgi:hypothetical protein